MKTRHLREYRLSIVKFVVPTLPIDAVKDLLQLSRKCTCSLTLGLPLRILLSTQKINTGSLYLNVRYSEQHNWLFLGDIAPDVQLHSTNTTC